MNKLSNDELIALFPNIALDVLGKPTTYTPAYWRYGKKGSLVLDIDRGLWYDHEHSEGGNIKELLEGRLKLRMFSVLERILGKEYADTPPPISSKYVTNSRHTQASAQTKTKNKNKDYALKIWKEAVGITNTLAERYLMDERSLLIEKQSIDIIRFHPECPDGKEKHPALISLLRNIHTNEPQSIQRTFLNKYAQKIDKKTLGSSKDAVIKYASNDEVTMGLFLAEGLETGITFASYDFVPMWITCGLSGIGSFPLLEGITSLTICADNDDDTLRKPIHELGIRYQEAGREFTVFMPKKTGTDGNDLHKEIKNGKQ